MIVPMQKLTLLCAAVDRERTVARLAELGVVHVTHLQRLESPQLRAIEHELAELERAIQLLPKRSRGSAGTLSAAAIARQVVAADQEARRLRELANKLRAERDRIAPLGEFDPQDLETMAARGLQLRFFRVEERVGLPVLPGVTLREISRADGWIHFVTLGAVDRVPGHEVDPPTRRLSEVEADLDATLRDLAAAEATPGRFAGELQKLQRARARCRGVVELARAEAGLREDGPVACLTGYVPTRAVGLLQQESAAQGWAVLCAEPEATDEVPTLVENPRWARPIESVFHAIGILPGYREADVSPVFLIFLSIFFAMLVGDAGYGLLFLGLAWIGRRKLPHIPREVFSLLQVMSFATIGWGVLTGTYFGIAATPGFLVPLRVAWLTNEKNVMLVCFLIGAVHLTIAHAWAALRCGRSLQVLAQLGWIATTWTMFLLARTMVLSEPLPGWTLWLFAGGTALIVCFLTPPRAFRSEWFNHVMLPLTLVSNFVDVVSYLRLFAVGTAGFQVAKAFNEMALAGSGVLAGLTGSLILFFGHGLNVLLCAMGVLVHGVRLNTLEFSAHLGIQWTGVPFRPLTQPLADLERS